MQPSDFFPPNQEEYVLLAESSKRLSQMAAELYRRISIIEEVHRNCRKITITYQKEPRPDSQSD